MQLSRARWRAAAAAPYTDSEDARRLPRSALAADARFGRQRGTSRLTKWPPCITLSYMAAVTIRLDPALQRQLDRLSKRLGRTRSDLVRDALRRQLAILRFDEARRQLMPFAEARGLLTDEDVFRDVS